MRRRNAIALPIDSGGAEWSVIFPEQVRGHESLLEGGLEAIRLARSEDLSRIESLPLTAAERHYVSTWPGEHYRLLPALCRVFRVRNAVEIGTWTGLGTLALALSGAQVTTFDVFPPSEIPGSHLRSVDPSAGVDCRVADLAKPGQFERHLDVLIAADLIFLDGPKDGHFEYAFLDLLLPELQRKAEPTLLVFDDTRVVPMIELWSRLTLPKLDLTSFGHYSGTGIAMVSARS